MSYESSLARSALRTRIYRQAQVPGQVRSGNAGAPGNRSLGPVEDISSVVGLVGIGLLGFAHTNDANGGFETNPGA
jgi:hypothetical protein